MNYTNYLSGILLNDEKLKNVIRSVLCFTEEKLIKHTGTFKDFKSYRDARSRIETTLAHPNGWAKIDIVYDTENMIRLLPPKKIRYDVQRYFEDQMTVYCYSMRPYVNQILNYKYKSDNIVDLLDEVAAVKKAKINGLCQDSDFSSKPFVFANSDNDSFGNCYVPQTDVWEKDGNRECVCVHMCDKFLTYHVSNMGTRIIPYNATCKFGGCCHASRVLRNGKPAGYNIDVPHAQIYTKGEKRR